MPKFDVSDVSYRSERIISVWRKLTWWLGKIRVSAITTFCRRPAAKTMTSAMSSGVRGSHPLIDVSSALMYGGLLAVVVVRIDCISLGLVTVEPHNGEFLQ
jgi:hypothetical protein